MIQNAIKRLNRAFKWQSLAQKKYINTYKSVPYLLFNSLGDFQIT